MAVTYEPIASVTISGSTTSSVTLSSIGSTWTDLRLVVQGSYTANGSDNLYYRFNGDNGTNYSLTFIYGDGSSAASARLSTQAQGILGQFSTTSGAIGTIVADIMSYPNTSVYKTSLSSSAVAGYRVSRWVNLWRSTNAVNEIYLFMGSNNFTSGTTVSLFGIKAA